MLRNQQGHYRGFSGDGLWVLGSGLSRVFNEGVFTQGDSMHRPAGIDPIEWKAVKAIAQEHQAQVLNYLKATGYRLGLLVNFGVYPKATIQRLAL
jgi:hypothetical protein